MTNTLQNIIKELKEGYDLRLGNEHFSNEIILNESLKSSILGDITFFNVDFRNVDSIGISSIKLSNSKQSIEIEESCNLEKILKDMNLIISTDQDEM
jgi:hypothetical protein